MIEDFELETEGEEDPNTLADLFEALPGFNEILEQWSNASKMRVWYGQKILTIGEDV